MDQGLFSQINGPVPHSRMINLLPKFHFSLLRLMIVYICRLFICMGEVLYMLIIES